MSWSTDQRWNVFIRVFCTTRWLKCSELCDVFYNIKIQNVLNLNLKNSFLLSSFTLVGTRPDMTSLMRSWKRNSLFLRGVKCLVCVVSPLSAGTFQMNVRLSNYIDIATLNNDNSVKLLTGISNTPIVVWIRFNQTPWCSTGNVFSNLSRYISQILLNAWTHKDW